MFSLMYGWWTLPVLITTSAPWRSSLLSVTLTHVISSSPRQLIPSYDKIVVTWLSFRGAHLMIVSFIRILWQSRQVPLTNITFSVSRSEGALCRMWRTQQLTSRVQSNSRSVAIETLTASRTISPKSCSRMFSQCMSGVVYLHANGGVQCQGHQIRPHLSLSNPPPTRDSGQEVIQLKVTGVVVIATLSV
jgi:hypothetical protein